MKTKIKKVEKPSVGKSTAATTDTRVSQILDELVEWSMNKK